MNRIFVTGDIHCNAQNRLSSNNFPVGSTLDRSDLVFIAGDFGCLWWDEPNRVETYELNWINDKPFTTMVVGGNHENWNRLRNLPMVEKFGVQLGEIRPNVFFIPNGTLIKYAGKKIFCMGGAMSTDKHVRVMTGPNDPARGNSCWEGEIPTFEEMDFGTRNLEAVDYEVDIIITHTMPIKSIEVFSSKFGYHQDRIADPTANYLSFIKEHTKFNKWFCGHFHMNDEYDGVTCLFDDIVNVDDESYLSYVNYATPKLYRQLWDLDSVDDNF